MKELPNALRPMLANKRWINWKLVERPGGKPDKLPVNPKTGDVCNAHDKESWCTFEEATATGMNIGFVFTSDIRRAFLDVDNCIDENGLWNEHAVYLAQALPGAAIEYSQSGRGLHFFFIVPEGFDVPHSNRGHSGLEYYTDGRFVALTGDRTMGNADTVVDAAALKVILNHYFPPSQAAVNPAEWTTEPHPDWRGPDDDDELIKRMLKPSKSAKAIFGDGVTVKDLWEKNDEALAKAYPDVEGQQGRLFDWSKADAALCSHLAFWTGGHAERMERLFNRSALTRTKWTDREDYRYSTIIGAISRCRNFYKERVTAAQKADKGVQGFQYYHVQEQIKLFEGCIYVEEVHKVFCPDGLLLDKDRFNIRYGGQEFCIDPFATGKSASSDDAWKVFTRSRAHRFPKVNRMCFRPELPPGHVFMEEGSTYVNTYVPVETKSVPGDVTPFLEFVEKLVPDQGDRDILLAYMAACVQYPGVKFQWAPLIQGTPGNGKSFLGACLSHCIGECYTEVVNPKDIGNKFNAWIEGCLLAIIEEVYTAGRVDTVETLKWMITNLRVPVQSKGKDQRTGDNRANFFMTTNHLDAILKTRHDRRFCVFYTAQQTVDDLAKWGMGGDYFSKLWDWARREGFAIINNYLRSYQIPDILNPATHCHRAPTTTSTNEAIANSKDPATQIIEEAIESGIKGFRGGWISSKCLDDLLDEKRVHVALNKRKALLSEMGYRLHPGLPGGRVNNEVPVEGMKPRLYVAEEHETLGLDSAAAISKRYQEDQGYQIGGLSVVPQPNVING